MSAKILIVDDEKPILRFFSKALSAYEVKTATSAIQAIKAYEAGESFDVVISDIHMPSLSGMDLLGYLANQETKPEVILITGHGNVESAVKAMKMGAIDYIQKPLEIDEVLVIVEKAVEVSTLRKNEKILRSRFDSVRLLGPADSKDKRIHVVQSLVEQAAISSSTNVLIEGELGTGKELVARSIHEKSDRNSMPFTALDCQLLNSTEYSSDYPSYWVHLFAKSEGGTLYLSNISSMPQLAQQTLSALLTDQTTLGPNEKAVRLISSSRSSLHEGLTNGEIRDDLYFKLGTLSISIPPLRERSDDIESLCYDFLDTSGMRAKIHSITPQAVSLLKRQQWRGNIRELRTVIINAATLSTGPAIDIEDLNVLATDTEENDDAESVTELELSADLSYAEALERAKDHAAKEYLKKLLFKVSGNITKAAKIAKIERGSLHRAIKRHGIMIEEYRSSGVRSSSASSLPPRAH